MDIITVFARNCQVNYVTDCSRENQDALLFWALVLKKKTVNCYHEQGVWVCPVIIV